MCTPADVILQRQNDELLGHAETEVLLVLKLRVAYVNNPELLHIPVRPPNVRLGRHRCTYIRVPFHILFFGPS